jgi:hypothetical protein
MYHKRTSAHTACDGIRVSWRLDVVQAQISVISMHDVQKSIDGIVVMRRVVHPPVRARVEYACTAPRYRDVTIFAGIEGIMRRMRVSV